MISHVIKAASRCAFHICRHQSAGNIMMKYSAQSDLVTADNMCRVYYTSFAPRRKQFLTSFILALLINYDSLITTL